jgi:hypothetical protein
MTRPFKQRAKYSIGVRLAMILLATERYEGELR